MPCSTAASMTHLRHKPGSTCRFGTGRKFFSVVYCVHPDVRGAARGGVDSGAAAGGAASRGVVDRARARATEIAVLLGRKFHVTIMHCSR